MIDIKSTQTILSIFVQAPYRYLLRPDGVNRYIFTGAVYVLPDIKDVNENWEAYKCADINGNGYYNC